MPEQFIHLTIADAQRDADGEQRRGQLQTTGTLEETSAGLVLRYAEVIDEAETQVIITLAEADVRICRQGALGMTLMLSAGQADDFLYRTPYGDLSMTAAAETVAWRRTEHGGEVALAYALRAQGELLTHNALDIVWRVEAAHDDA